MRFSCVDFNATCPKLADFYRKSSDPLVIGSACPGFYDFYDLLLMFTLGKVCLRQGFDFCAPVSSEMFEVMSDWVKGKNNSEVGNDFLLLTSLKWGHFWEHPFFCLGIRAPTPLPWWQPYRRQPVERDDFPGAGWCAAGLSTSEAPAWRNSPEEPGFGKGKSLGSLDKWYLWRIGWWSFLGMMNIVNGNKAAINRDMK